MSGEEWKPEITAFIRDHVQNWLKASTPNPAKLVIPVVKPSDPPWLSSNGEPVETIEYSHLIFTKQLWHDGTGRGYYRAIDQYGRYVDA